MLLPLRIENYKLSLQVIIQVRQTYAFSNLVVKNELEYQIF